MSNGAVTVSLDVLIEAALTNRPYNQQRLGREAKRYSYRISKARASELPEDLHEDVFQEAFMYLFRWGASALDGRSGKAAFRRAVLASIRKVRASYAPPGQKTRPVENDPREVAAEDVGRIPDAETLKRGMVGEGPGRTLDFDLLESDKAASSMKQVEDRLDVEFILAEAPAVVASSLRRIHMEGEAVADVAADAVISRFALHRQIASFCAEWRLAA